MNESTSNASSARWALRRRTSAPSNGAANVKTFVVPICAVEGRTARIRRPASAHARFMWCNDASASIGWGPRRPWMPPAMWPITDNGSLKTIQCFTRSP